MAINRRIVLDQIAIRADGAVLVQLQKQLVEGDNVLNVDYHRTSIPPDVKTAERMASVNAHLKQEGWPALDKADIDRIAAHTKVAHTPQVVAAHKKAQKAA